MATAGSRLVGASVSARDNSTPGAGVSLEDRTEAPTGWSTTRSAVRASPDAPLAPDPGVLMAIAPRRGTGLRAPSLVVALDSADPALVHRREP